MPHKVGVTPTLRYLTPVFVPAGPGKSVQIAFGYRKDPNNRAILTLMLQKPRVLQMQGVPFDKLRGEAGVVYADPLAGRLPTGPNLWFGPREAI
jgi:hypothetical protein